MKFFSSLIIFIANCFIVCYGRQANPVFDKFNFESGLSSNEIRGIAQDEDGFLWIGTTEGLNRYDGNSFFQYFKSDRGLAENDINDLVALPNHRIAIATGHGLNFFDTHQNSFSVFRSNDTSALSDFKNNFLRLCVDKAGDLWATTQTDLYLFDSSLHLLRKFSSEFSAKDINQKRMAFVWEITALPDGNVLIFFSDHLSVYNTSSSTLYDLSKQVSSRWSFLTKQGFSNVCISDKYERFWFLKTHKDSIYEYDMARNTIISFFLFPGASGYFSFTTNMFCIDFNHILIQLPGRGFYELSLRQSASRILCLNRLEPNFDRCYYLIDRQNNFWIGTYTGLYEWSSFKNQFHTINFTEEKSPSEVLSFLHTGDGLWICSYGYGIYSYDLENKTIRRFTFQLPGTTMLSATWNIRRQSRDTFWVGTQEGLLWFVPSKRSYGRIRYMHPAVLDSFPVTTQFVDKRGCVWMGVGLGHGVVCFDSTKNSFISYDSHSSFPLRYPTAIAEDEFGNLWMGTQIGGGLVKWNSTSNMFAFTRAKSGTAFSDSRINDLYADHKGHIWMATFLNGLVRYDIATGNFESFGKKEGLSHENIYGIKPAQYPYLWMTTSFGLNRFNMITGTFEAFFKKDGLPTDELSEGIYYDSLSGMMYLGLKSSFIEFNAKHFSTDETLPKVIINSVMVNNQPVNQDLNRVIHLDYLKNNLTVGLTAIDLVNGSDLKFRFRLEDEKSWSDAGKNREIHFSNLSPGNYSLLVEAANANGTWNEKATALNFYIIPPFWKTTWFYFLISVIIILLTYALYRFRIRQLQHVQEMRNRIARDLHDDIGGTMTAMNLTNELAMQNLNKPTVAKKLLMDISEDLKNAGEALDDIVWTVNPKNDSMAEVMARMRRYASRTWEAAGIDFNFEFQKNTESIRLNMEQRHDLYLAFKEAVNNTAKHSQCEKASSSVSLKDHRLLVEIKDNGKGFDVNIPSHRNGIKNMQSRMQKWRGSFEIYSSEGEGTMVRFHMPITQKGD